MKWLTTVLLGHQSSKKHFLILQIRHLKCFTRAVLLEAIVKGEGIVHFIVLKNIKSAIEQDFPAIVCLDVAGVNRAGVASLFVKT